MIEYATFKIRNLHRWVKDDLPLEKTSQDKNQRKETFKIRNPHGWVKDDLPHEKTSQYKNQRKE